MRLYLLAITSLIVYSCIAQQEENYEKAAENVERTLEKAISAYCEQDPSAESCQR